jgi:uncharacterized protein YbjT (DUF2867 family)
LFLLTPLPSLEEHELGLLDLAKKAGIKHIVKLSAFGAASEEVSLHRLAEKRIEASGIPYTHLRPTWFNQNFSTAQVGGIRGGVLALPAGDGTAGFIDVRDIAAVAATVLTAPGHKNKAYTLTGSESLNHTQVAGYLSKALDREVKYIPLTDEAFRAAVAPFLPAFYIDILSDLYYRFKQNRESLITPTVAEVLGRPPIRFEQFALDYANVWK